MRFGGYWFWTSEFQRLEQHEGMHKSLKKRTLEGKDINENTKEAINKLALRFTKARNNTRAN